MTNFGGPLNNFSVPQASGYGQQNNFGPQLQTQQTGFIQNQPFMNGQAGGPFADPRNQQFSPISMQPTGFQSSFSPPPQQFPQQTGLNSFLPPALQPQQTGALTQQQPGLNGFGQGFGQPPPPPIPRQQTIAPLVPQQTGPPPPVRFGVSGDTKKLMPQATGRRANLAQASKSVPSRGHLQLTILSSPKSLWLLGYIRVALFVNAFSACPLCTLKHARASRSGSKSRQGSFLRSCSYSVPCRFFASLCRWLLQCILIQADHIETIHPSL